jgi:hypothetical protein
MLTMLALLKLLKKQVFNDSLTLHVMDWGNWMHSASLARFQPCQHWLVSHLIVAGVGSRGIWETEEQRHSVQWGVTGAGCPS